MSKITELSQTTTIDPEALFYCAEDGQDKAVKFKTIRDTIQSTSQDYYGMIIHQNVSNPSSGRVDYIGLNTNYTPMSMNLTTGACSYGSWANMPTLIKNVPAMIKTNGTLDYYLNPNDYSKKLDGTTASDVANTSYDGNAMSWFEPIWMRIKAIGDDLDVRFAYSKLDDDYYEVCPHNCGVWLPMFYGSVVDTKMRSIAETSVLGGVTGNTTTAAQYESITNNGSNYLFYGGKLAECITLLCVMWFKSTNSDTWGTGNRSGYNASAADGRYGTKSNPIVGGGQFYGTSTSTAANKILHSVALGTYDVWLRDPYFLCVNGEFKVSKDYTYDPTGVNYTSTGILSPDGGYQVKLTPIDGFGFVPTSVGGGSTTYYCDNYWVNKTITAVALRFGACGNGATAGAFALTCANTAAYSTWNFGCALILKQSS